TLVWAVLAALGALAFLVGVNSADAASVWSIYLVNLVFWSGLAVTGPAIAGMMQLTEARWSPSVRRLAVTTAGFLPAAFVVLLVLFVGGAPLYPGTTNRLRVRAVGLNTPFFWGRNVGLALVLFFVCLAFARMSLRDPIPPDNGGERIRRNR